MPHVALPVALWPPFGLCRSGQRDGSHVFELWYNGALLAYKAGDFQISFEMVRW